LEWKKLKSCGERRMKKEERERRKNSKHISEHTG
jgi:hypothetical protein